jgi:cytochrome c oxidase assembly protein subunit 15
MVVVGGVTRLTRSGLSMTDWKFTGERYPRSQDEWEAEFAKYRRSPEFKRVNSRMTLEEFQNIFFMEWAHRMWGRTLGVVFAVPCAYFVARGALPGPLLRRLGLIFAAGGCQGLVGWWMVKSGLEEANFPNPHDLPTVSPYRLATHLVSAFGIYTALLWTTLSVAFPLAASGETGPPPARLLAVLRRLRGGALPFGCLVGVTALSGAYVAGNQAGLAYNTFPLMGGRLVPEEYWDAGLGLRNFFENTATVQFNHRALAVVTLCSAGVLWGTFRSAGLPAAQSALVRSVFIGASAQAALGVATLLMHVPVALGSAHQAGALAVMSVTVALLHSLRSPAAVAAAAQRLAASGLKV